VPFWGATKRTKQKMKLYLKSVVNQLRNYSATLDKTSILIDKPWALIDEEHEMQKLIFKKDKELILSKNGQVQIGRWDYFPEAKSLLIDRNTDKILCNEAFIDKGVMVLRLDGTDSKFFILTNENIVPDLNATRYLKELRYQKLRIIETILKDGRILEVQRENDEVQPQIGNSVTEEAETVEDGKYQLANLNQYFEIKRGRIFKILTETTYFTPNGQEIIIQQQVNWKIWHGDYVFMFGKQVDNAIIDFSKSKNLVVRDGIVIRLERKNNLMRWISKFLNSYWGTYNK
jgi:hypothetical protein